MRSLEQKRGKILADLCIKLLVAMFRGRMSAAIILWHISHGDLDVTRQAGSSWRLFFKAEVVRQAGKEPKDNPRFVITHLKQSPQWIYEQFYGARGEIENRLKELHHGLEIDRTSCSRFWANQLRVLMTAAAYALMQELRLRAVPTDCARAQVWTLRERLLKLGAQAVVFVRRVAIHLPFSFPFLNSFRQIALSFGALSG